MRIHIVNDRLDEIKLQTEIMTYTIIHQVKPYLFMNTDTMNALGERHNVHNLILAQYNGYKCYVDNDLAFGEVEIR